MTAVERDMVSVLVGARESFGVSGVKASMEAEGVSLPELARTKDITTAASIGFSVKIGGCEALTDARLAKDYGVTTLMAPMIESRFALEKFLSMADSVFPGPAGEGLARYINIETKDGCDKIADILDASNVDRLDGIVLGRTDLSAALGESDVDSPVVLAAARNVFEAACAKGVDCLVGGGLSENSVPFLLELGDLVTGFETRKVVFDRMPDGADRVREAIRSALRFELLWYRSRKDYFAPLFTEDEGRIRKLEACLG